MSLSPSITELQTDSVDLNKTFGFMLTTFIDGYNPAAIGITA